jgi:hypothetical protein
MTLSPANPPRTAERLLIAFGTDSEFSDAIVGDLTEEFLLRVRWDGAAAARRWYYRECIRVAPYLLGDWWRERRLRDAAHIAKAVVLSSLIVYAVEKIVAQALGPAVTAWWRMVGQSPAYLASMLCWTTLDGVVCGYLVARIGRRAAVVSTLAAAAVWMAFGVGIDLIGRWTFVGSMGTVWYRAVNSLMLVTGITIGGLSRVAWRGTERGISP